MTTKLQLAIAAAIAASFSVSASAEVIPLFDATPITDSGFSPNINERFVYDSADTTVYCSGDGTAYLRTVDDANNYLIVDNYVTLNDADTTSICIGGNTNLGGGPVTGTNCFNSGSASSSYWGDAIETVFASNATAPIDLTDGENNVTVKLWDWGGVYGNTALEPRRDPCCCRHHSDQQVRQSGTRQVPVRMRPGRRNAHFVLRSGNSAGRPFR